MFLRFFLRFRHMRGVPALFIHVILHDVDRLRFGVDLQTSEALHFSRSVPLSKLAGIVLAGELTNRP
jgi:hypothetical protein